MSDATITSEDPIGVFAMTEAAADAAARKILQRAGVYSPTAKQLDDARESAAIRVRGRRTRRDDDRRGSMSAERPALGFDLRSRLDAVAHAEQLDGTALGRRLIEAGVTAREQADRSHERVAEDE